MFGEKKFDKPVDFLNLDKIYNKAKETIDRDRIDTKEFEDLYGEEQVKRDNEYVRKMERKFDSSGNQKEKDAKKIATIFEAILGEQIELSEWFGSDICTMATTKFDDIVNGVDVIAEFSENKTEFAHLGLAVDATYSADFDSKFLKIKENINKGKLATIKYFNSSDMDFIGQLSQVPRVIIAADAKTVTELIELWDTDKKQDLAKHPIQFQILEQIILQLKVFKDYIQSIKYNKEVDNDRIIKKFEIFIEIFEMIYKNRQENITDSGKRDGTLDKIQSYLDMYFKI